MSIQSFSSIHHYHFPPHHQNLPHSHTLHMAPVQVDALKSRMCVVNKTTTAINQLPAMSKWDVLGAGYLHLDEWFVFCHLTFCSMGFNQVVSIDYLPCEFEKPLQHFFIRTFCLRLASWCCAKELFATLSYTEGLPLTLNDITPCKTCTIQFPISSDMVEDIP